MFQGYHALEQQTFARDPLLEALVDSGRFNKDAATNLINMPKEKGLAHALGVSPHSGGPLQDYKIGSTQVLKDLASTKDGIAALGGDAGALDRMAMKVQRLRPDVRCSVRYWLRSISWSMQWACFKPALRISTSAWRLT
ncbi:hypothetical protein NY99_21435 [Xanthomonas phaseoli pv. phaseoli]|uniref:hypothetical protein n=1 Tax=Xanthomonas phaseoli TaxID=1985254 RepID=UPI0005377FE4|nr:hypothetical protein [Xanthomonas phaseoli]KGU50777.1 hypothetical protein NY99_21435 [Xanthomonas phaseoli pv. phaseoli]KHF47883.1 hypothetical protein QQ30_13875 [Xanthomonas phaseoli pv. phaseoli]KHS05399.1 hypothetical protein RM61_21685 [Xanthomonas phaseoli pv. phaseoli]KHS26809.1 hypothetical protein RM60_15695 [Xanthomonas phaseoli pv. phaseoli]